MSISTDVSPKAQLLRTFTQCTQSAYPHVRPIEPSMGYMLLREELQTHFQALLRKILEAGYDLITNPQDPESDLDVQMDTTNEGDPYLMCRFNPTGNKGEDLEAWGSIYDRIVPFYSDVLGIAQATGVAMSGGQKEDENSFFLLYPPKSMHAVLLSLTQNHRLRDVDTISRLNLISHLNGRFGAHGYVPAQRLN